MTTEQPISPEPADSSQPAWGSAPATPPPGSGSDRPGNDRPGSDQGPTFTTTAPGATTQPGATFFDRLRSLQIVRPDPGQGRLLAGVAAAVARRLRVDPVVVRIAFVVLGFFAGLGVLLYGLGWLFLPHPDGRIHAQQVLHGTVTAGFVGALLTVLAIAHHAIPLLVVALIVWMIVRHCRTSQAHAC